MWKKLILYVLCVLLVLGGLASVGLSQTAQTHHQVAMQGLTMVSLRFAYSYSGVIKDFFGSSYILTVHFKTSNGNVLDVYLTDPKYIDEYKNLSGYVHYYKHAASDEGALSIPLQNGKEIALVIINGEFSSTVVDIDITTNISDTLFWGGLIALFVGFFLALYGRVKYEDKKPPHEMPPRPQTDDVSPKPRVYKPIPLGTTRREEPSTVIRKLKVLAYARDRGLISQEEYEAKKRELISQL